MTPMALVEQSAKAAAVIQLLVPCVDDPAARSERHSAAVTSLTCSARFSQAFKNLLCHNVLT
jgi:hypothetical protein